MWQFNGFWSKKRGENFKIQEGRVGVITRKRRIVKRELDTLWVKNTKCIFVLVRCHFSPILVILFFKHSRKCDGARKFVFEIKTETIKKKTINTIKLGAKPIQSKRSMLLTDVLIDLIETFDRSKQCCLIWLILLKWSKFITNWFQSKEYF